MTDFKCDKKDCVFQKNCLMDEVSFFLCGSKKSNYTIEPPAIHLKEIDKLISEVKSMDRISLNEKASQLGISKPSHYSLDQVRQLICYKAQEDLRAKHKLETPEYIKRRIKLIMDGVNEVQGNDKEETIMSKKKTGKKSSAKSSNGGVKIGLVITDCVCKGMSYKETAAEVKKVTGKEMGATTYPPYVRKAWRSEKIKEDKGRAMLADFFGKPEKKASPKEVKKATKKVVKKKAGKK